MFGKKCCMPNYMNPCNNEPIMEPMINKCVEKEFVHEVKHCCPINTHVVNKHIFNHTYTPLYTTTEEDIIINNDNGGCCKFMGR